MKLSAYTFLALIAASAPAAAWDDHKYGHDFMHMHDHNMTPTPASPVAPAPIVTPPAAIIPPAIITPTPTPAAAPSGPKPFPGYGYATPFLRFPFYGFTTGGTVPYYGYHW